jgi:hypothetical protein
MATKILSNILTIRDEHDALTQKLSVLEAKQADLQQQLAGTAQAIEAASAKYASETREFAAGNAKADPGGALAQKDFLEHKRHGLDQLLASTTAELEPLVQQRVQLAERIQRQAEADKLEELIADQTNKTRAFEDAQRKFNEAQESMWAANSAVSRHRKATELDQRRRERGQ